MKSETKPKTMKNVCCNRSVFRFYMKDEMLYELSQPSDVCAAANCSRTT